MKTNVHFPTDINLLFDAMRKSIDLTGKLFESLKLSEWRQYKYNIRKIKRAFRLAQQSKKNTTKNAVKKIKKQHKKYIELSNWFLCRIVSSLNSLVTRQLVIMDMLTIETIYQYIEHARRQINQIDRRVLKNEVIPHHEKVFSLFEPHTEWIMKGKARESVELGIKVGIIEDQYCFILNHRIMQKETDEQSVLSFVTKTKEFFSGIFSFSFDRGYYSARNREELNKIVPHIALPKKGKLSNKDREIQKSESFKKAKEKHSAVESAINALDVHGLDKCLDHGIQGFKRYVAVAIASKNIQRIGSIIHERNQKFYKKHKFRKRLAKAA